MSALAVLAEIQDGQAEPVRVAVEGRPAWALLRLVEAGPDGLTTLAQPAPRWSAYVHRLRKLGVSIATEYEAHGGPFAGSHGRYKLQSIVRLIRVEGVQGGAA